LSYLLNYKFIILGYYDGDQRNNFRAKAKENDRGAGSGTGEC